MVLGRSSLPFFFAALALSAPAFAQNPPPADAAPAPAPAPLTVAPPAPPADPVQSGASSTLPPAAAAEANPPGGLPKPNAAPVPTDAPAPAPAKAGSPPQLKLDAGNGTTIRFGVMWQGQLEAKGNSANDDLSRNLYIRRFCLIIGGTILKDFEYFFDSDFADLFKAPTGEAGLKNGPSIQTKDAFATYRVLDDKLKIDGGLMLPP
ncbi:MAG TPA: hypothetical protein VEQ59_12380, partial [Polyangiaceae bacterium]|nr:hypothetical protein [Polyangiaceae bacterium]